MLKAIQPGVRGLHHPKPDLSPAPFSYFPPTNTPRSHFWSSPIAAAARSNPMLTLACAADPRAYSAYKNF